MLLTLPNELLTRICCFVNVKTLANLCNTCTFWTFIAQQKDAWTNALFTYDDEWYQLKNVALTCKYMEWSKRIAYPPPSFDTMDNVAFFGILTDENDNQIATFGPKICAFELDGMDDGNFGESGIALWSTKFEDKITYTWKTNDLRKTFIQLVKIHYLEDLEEEWVHADPPTLSHPHHMRAQIYTLVKRDNDYGIYKLGSCTTENPNGGGTIDGTDLVFFFDDTHPNDPGSACIFHTEGISIEFWDELDCTKDWLDTLNDEKVFENQIQMLQMFAASDANAGRGWNQTRRFIVDTTLAQLQKVYDGHIA